MAANASSVHNVSGTGREELQTQQQRSDTPLTQSLQVRSGRSNMNSSAMNNDRARGSHGNNAGKSFGAGKSSWQNNIWGDSNLGGGFADDQHISETAFEGKSGSGSLLSSSESDGWVGRPNLPWSTVNTSSLAMGQNRSMATSPIETRANDRSAPALNNNGDSASSYFALPRTTGIGTSAGTVSHRPYLNNGGSESVSPSGDGLQFGGFPALRNGDGRRQMSTTGLGGSPVGATFPTKAGFSHPMDGQRQDDLATPMNMSSLSGLPDSMSPPQTRTGLSHISSNSASYASQRPVHAARPSFYSDNNSIDGRYAGGTVDLNAGLNNLQLNDGGYAGQSAAQRPAYIPHASFDGSLPRKFQNSDEAAYHTMAAYATDGAPDMIYSRSRGGETGSISPSEYARMDSPIYAGVDGAQYRNSGGRVGESQIAAFERRMRLQQEELAQSQGNGMQRMQMPPSYDYQGYQAARLNAIQGYYTMPALGLGAAAMVNRSHREHDPTQVVRSPLLEEFRANSKGNKRYELKDIYNHVVEFSGDQHGSRFIQQKLETANSDEKEQVFREIQPNCLQLMTDVFGNYVVQKLFEHGNQTQKKILANQMRGHVLALSTQMYGCRVVQKALEHILTDQQAIMVKELENHVLKCVRDQNGNHVIQKAIERVPSHYVQFIINAFRGQVNRLAAHPYGCRVIQRMLEHCEEVDRESILGELHACTTALIPDQFGNYVIQHVIENGDEKDRNRMIVIVMGQLMAYSKHKFASNVVEKSIEFGEESQRHHIISTLTSSPDRNGESPLLGLMRDQYGNYVIQKVLGQLKGAEREALIDQIKPLLSQLKKFSYGKQIVAIEKLIFDPNNPATGPLPHTTSTTPPNSHKSSPQPSKRSIPMEQPRAFNTVDDSLESKGLAHSTVTSVSSPETGNTGVAVPVDVTSAH
ncbi:hypothetical protein N7533_013116 [Penicillium manginii]|uniref:uncharacterized protein n=1 Tax=Penicillium manginii TaxID=203109 RepID=UPI0025466878|nr:uncharacterized protein N7533_013116 [Penicillium manginii]KAJ5734713.1 hypothetical protein N7533_013116 [Penicillium manginii]